MRLEGLVWKDEGSRFWVVEVPALAVVSQGTSRRDALEMIQEAIEITANREGFRVEVVPGKGENFFVRSDDAQTLVAFLLRQQRISRNLTLEEMARRLGVKSLNAYARYEQGKSVPTVAKLLELLHAIDPENEPVLKVG